MSAVAPLPDVAPLRFSTIKWMSRSAAHAKYALENPEAIDSPSMRLGRIAHKLILGATPGPDSFVVFEGERRGKAWTEFKELNVDADIISAAEFEKASAMAASVAAHDEAQEVLQGEKERRLLFDYAGRLCQVTPDCFSPTLLTEIKTTADASPGKFPWQSLREAYPAQLAWQLHGIAANGMPIPGRVSIIAVENKPPFPVCVFSVLPAALAFGRRTFVAWIEEFLNAERSGIWGGYGPGVLDAPPEEFGLDGMEESEE